MSDPAVANRTGAGRMRIPRSRGAVTGILLIGLGLWTALIPFIGPGVGFAYAPDDESVWTALRGWLQVLPGVVTVAGGVLLLLSRNRATALFGAWLGVVAGAWLVVGRAAAEPLGLGSVDAPVATGGAREFWLEMTHFTGVGALIMFLAALSMGRLSVRSLRDIRYEHASAGTLDTTDEHRHDPHTDPVRASKSAETEQRPMRKRLEHLIGTNTSTAR